MKTPENARQARAARLKFMREERGYEEPATFAHLVETPELLYIAHENGRRDILQHHAEKYGAKLRATAEWLMYETGPTPPGVDLRRLPKNLSFEETKKARGKRLQEAREAMGWDEKQLAINAKVSKTSVTQHELGHWDIPPDHLTFYALSLGVDEEWIKSGTGRGPKKRPGGEPASAPVDRPPQGSGGVRAKPFE